jgi:hypothetical protein
MLAADARHELSIREANMRLEPLYRMRFTYPHGWSVDLSGDHGTEAQHFFFAEGHCTGRISGRLHGANFPRSRADGTFLPHFQGVIETDDGASILFDMRGYGRAYPVGRRQIVAMCFHVSDDERYQRLNDVVCVATGEVRSVSDSDTVLVIDLAELVWEPIHD